MWKRWKYSIFSARISTCLAYETKPKWINKWKLIELRGHCLVERLNGKLTENKTLNNSIWMENHRDNLDWVRSAQKMTLASLKSTLALHKCYRRSVAVAVAIYACSEEFARPECQATQSSRNLRMNYWNSNRFPSFFRICSMLYGGILLWIFIV